MSTSSEDDPYLQQTKLAYADTTNEATTTTQGRNIYDTNHLLKTQIYTNMPSQPATITSICYPPHHMDAHRVHGGVLEVGEGDQSGQRKCERVNPAGKILKKFAVDAELGSLGLWTGMVAMLSRVKM